MSVISVSLPLRNSARLSVSAALHGVEIEQVEVEGATVYADLTGSPEKILRSCLGSGVTVHDVTEYTEKPGTKFPGTEGEGIPLGDAINRSRVYSTLMKAAR